MKNGTYEVDGIKANKSTFASVINQLHQDITPELRNKIMNIHLSSLNDISNKEVWFIYNSVLDYGFHRIVTANQEIIRRKGNKPFAIGSNYTEDYYETELNSNQKTIPTINGIACDQCTVNLSRKGIENLVLGTNTNQKVESFKN